MAILKTATINEAQQALEQGSFVYSNPCCICGKQCSTPTKDIWMRRIQEFGGIQQMYQQYKCRNCRKAEPLNNVAKEPVHSVATQPLVTLTTSQVVNAKNKPEQEPAKEPAAPVRRTPKPGDAVRAPEGCVGISVWETNNAGEMEYRGTQWAKIFKKEVEGQ
jgi:hypothetical protein